MPWPFVRKLQGVRGRVTKIVSCEAPKSGAESSRKGAKEDAKAPRELVLSFFSASLRLRFAPLRETTSYLIPPPALPTTATSASTQDCRPTTSSPACRRTRPPSRSSRASCKESPPRCAADRAHHTYSPYPRHTTTARSRSALVRASSDRSSLSTPRDSRSRHARASPSPAPSRAASPYPVRTSCSPDLSPPHSRRRCQPSA